MTLKKILLHSKKFYENANYDTCFLISCMINEVVSYFLISRKIN